MQCQKDQNNLGVVLIW